METQYISLNMTPTGVNPCFHISQYDVGRMLGFIVHSGGATVDLDTYTCTIEATRSDGTAITSAVATTDNIGTFEVTPTMSNKADKYRCQLVIVDENSKRIASLPFDMEVTKAAMDENSEAIEEDASLYQQYTKAVQGAIAEANADIQAEENARIAAVNAEATARQNADATLQNNIDAEATARKSADNTLQGNINSEASTRASADSNLQSQINQIVAPSGEAPSTAEVQNARIGANGVTYNTLGTAIRSQVNGLNENLDDLEEGLIKLQNEKELYFQTGYTSFFYKFKKGHTYRVTNDSDSMNALWTTDSNGKTIETISAGMNAHAFLNFHCSTNAEKAKIYANGAGTLKIVEHDLKIEKIENDISDISKKIVVGRNKFNKYDITTGYFLYYNTGVQNANSDWCFTNFVEIKSSTEYYTNYPNGHYCFYDEDKKYISGVTSSSTFTTPPTAKYIRASVRISAIDSVYIYEGNSGDRYEPFKYKFIYDDDYKNKQSVIIVDKSGNGDYTSVTQACADAPKGSTIFIKAGVYENEQITGTYTKKLYLIGESAQDVIIKNNTGQYLHEPIQIGSGLLRNLTFYAELEEGQERKEGQIEYAVHVESHNLANDNLTIENCILKSDYSPALGMGMRGGCNVIIKSCRLIGTHYGTLIIHDSDYDAYLGVQNVSLLNNVIEVMNNTTCVIFQSQEKEASTVNIECIGNRVYSPQNGTLIGFRNYYGGVGSENDWHGLKNWRLKGTSWGNSTDILN